MTSQKSALSVKKTYKSPQTYGAISLVKQSGDDKRNYVIRRLKLDPIEISEKGRNAVLQALENNRRFIQLADYTVMLNSITSIEPLPKKRSKKQFNPDDYDLNESDKQEMKQGLEKLRKMKNDILG